MIGLDDKVVGLDVKKGEEKISPPTVTKSRPEHSLHQQGQKIGAEQDVIEEGLSRWRIDVVVDGEQLACHSCARQKQRKELSDDDRDDRSLRGQPFDVKQRLLEGQDLVQA